MGQSCSWLPREERHAPTLLCPSASQAAQGSQWEQNQPHQNKASRQGTALWFHHASGDTGQITPAGNDVELHRRGVQLPGSSPMRPLLPQPRRAESKDPQGKRHLPMMNGADRQQVVWCLPS